MGSGWVSLSRPVVVLMEQVMNRKGLKPGKEVAAGLAGRCEPLWALPSASVGLLPPPGPTLPWSLEGILKSVLLTFLTCAPSPWKGVSGHAFPWSGNRDGTGGG